MLIGGLWCGYWETDTNICPDLDSVEPADLEHALTMAWQTLRLLTSGLIGSCKTTIRPCVASPCSSCREVFIPALRTYSNMSGVSCERRSDCSCNPISEIVLPGRVAAVSWVSIDGTWLSEDVDFRLDGNRLVRLSSGHAVDGDAWPSCQDMRAGPEDSGSFVVSYIPGVPQGAASARAAGVLACEYLKASSTGKCRLPSSVTTLSRQGVTMELDSGLFSNGLTGIREVDMFILSVNPNRLRSVARVWSPDAPGHRVVGV